MTKSCYWWLVGEPQGHYAFCSCKIVPRGKEPSGPKCQECPIKKAELAYFPLKEVYIVWSELVHFAGKLAQMKLLKDNIYIKIYLIYKNKDYKKALNLFHRNIKFFQFSLTWKVAAMTWPTEVIHPAFQQNVPEVKMSIMAWLQCKLRQLL